MHSGGKGKVQSGVNGDKINHSTGFQKHEFQLTKSQPWPTLLNLKFQVVPFSHKPQNPQPWPTLPEFEIPGSTHSTWAACPEKTLPSRTHFNLRYQMPPQEKKSKPHYCYHLQGVSVNSFRCHAHTWLSPRYLLNSFLGILQRLDHRHFNQLFSISQ